MSLVQNVMNRENRVEGDLEKIFNPDPEDPEKYDDPDEYRDNEEGR